MLLAVILFVCGIVIGSAFTLMIIHDDRQTLIENHQFEIREAVKEAFMNGWSDAIGNPTNVHEAHKKLFGRS